MNYAINETIGLACAFPGSYIQSDIGSHDFTGGEFEAYRSLAALIKPKTYLEVGVYCGYSAIAVISGAGPAFERYAGIDHQMYRKNSNEMALRALEQFRASTRHSFNFEVLDLDTQPLSPEELQTRLHQAFDWVHIDADHTEIGALADISLFWPLTKRVMTVHDIVSHVEVRQAFGKIKDHPEKMPGLGGILEIGSVHGFGALLRQ